MFSNEYATYFNISPDGQRIGIGTSLGRLIVTSVKHLTGIYDSNNGGQADGSGNAPLCIQPTNVNNNNINAKVILMVDYVQMKMLIVNPFCTLCMILVWVSRSKATIKGLNDKFLESVHNKCCQVDKRRYIVLICAIQKDKNKFVLLSSKSNMSCYDCKKRKRVDKSSSLFRNMMASMQTYNVVLANEQN